MTGFFAAFGIFVVALPFLLLTAFVGMMWRSWWLYPAWDWFVVPLGIPPVSFWHFTAILVLIQVLTVRADEKQDDRPVNWYKTAALFIWPMLTWALLRWMR